MKKKYYSLTKILKENADYNIIIGERSNGKTFACLQYAIEDFVKNGNESAYLRRWKEDIIGKRAEQIFSAISQSSIIQKITENEYSDVVFYRGKFYLANYDTEKKRFIASKKPFCYAFALSDMEHDKSTSYPRIKNIIYDEFLTRQYYLPDEFVIYMNVLSTIIRDKKDVKIFMLGNTVNKYCPYFEEMGLVNVNKQEQGTIDVYSYGDSGLNVAVEYCGTIEKKKESSKYFAFSNPKLNMITNGAWELAIYPHLSQGQKIKESDIVFRFFIVFGTKIIEGDIIENGYEYFIFFHYKTTPINNYEKNLVYTLNYSTMPNERKCFLSKTTALDKKICWFFSANKVFYQSNDIGEIVNNYLAECIKGGLNG